MKISDYINDSKKKQWVRRIQDAVPQQPGRKRRSIGPPKGSFVVMTQDMFLNEITPGAHDVNSKYMSKRPIYGPTGKKNAQGKEEYKIVGYDDVESVALGIQECVIQKKISHFAADGFWIANETDDRDRFDKLTSWLDMSGITTSAWIELIRSVFRTGDGAIYIYQTEDGLDYKVFGYEEGSILYPKTDLDGKTTVARKYSFDGKSAVDIFTDKTVETWMQIEDDDETIVPKDGREKSEDGYVLVRRKDAQAGSGRCQCIYFRVPDIPTGPAQLSIESLEDACSYNAEEMKNTAFPILFLKSEKIVNLPPSKMNGKTIGVKGPADAVAHSDAKFLDPPDASNIATIHLETLWNNIVRTCMSVFVEPDVLKQGADSSTTIKILFAPEIQWCQNMWPLFFKGVRDIVNVCKALVGKIEGETSEYEKLRVSVGQNIWMPQNVAEKVKNECDQVYARIKSREAAMEDLGSQHVGDYGKIKEEWEYELQIKAEIPAKVKAQYGNSDSDTTTTDDDNPSKPGVDNNSPGRTIQE